MVLKTYRAVLGTSTRDTIRSCSGLMRKEEEEEEAEGDEEEKVILLPVLSVRSAKVKT